MVYTQMRQGRRLLQAVVSFTMLTVLVSLSFLYFGQQASQVAHAVTKGPMGVNVDGIADYSPTFVFTDVIKQGRRWGSIATPWDGTAPVDSNGWPTSDAASILITLDNARFNVSGTYKLTFTGQADVRGYDGGGSTNFAINNKTYNSGTNITTADVVVPAGNANLWLAFTNTKRTASSATNTGITNIRCIRPGYPSDGSQVFTTPFINSFSIFRSFRAMDLTSTNNQNATNWSDRTKTSGSQAVNGIAWEYVIQLANQTGKDVWINVPHKATDDYVTQLATLVKNTLNANLNVYVEYSNEVWNYSFQQAPYNRDVAQSDSSLKWDGATDQYQIATRRVGKRIVQISNIFKNVWGASAINTRVRPVLAWQVGNTWGLQQQLDTIQQLYGTPNQYIYALSTAPYMHEGDGNGVSQDTSSVNAIVNGLYADSDNNRSKSQDVTTLAHGKGLKHLAYEGGTHTPGTTDLNNRIAANRDARMSDLLQHDIGTNWFGTGGDMFMYFTNFSNYGQYGMWGLSESVFDTNSPKWQGAKAVSDLSGGTTPTPTPTPPPSGGQTVFISDIAWFSATNGIGAAPNKDKSTNNNALKVNNVTYAKGLGAHSPSTVIYKINGAYQKFISDVGVDSECGSGTVVFQVFLDGNKVFDSGTMTGNAVKNINTSVAGKNELKLIVTDAGDGGSCDHADWAGAKLQS